MKTDVNAASHDTLLAQVLDGYLSACRRGERPDAGRLVADHPEIAGELRTCLASLEFLEHVGHDSGLIELGEASAATAENGSGAAMAAAGPTLGDFRIVREVGRGGMGVVYEAEQISLQRRVALKTLPFAGVLDRRQLARFKNEALAAAALQHPNIVPVYAVGVDRGVHYYAMQYISGHNLAELIRQMRIREGLDKLEEMAETQPLEDRAALRAPPKSDSSPPADSESPRQQSVSTLVALKDSFTQQTRRQRQEYYKEVARIGAEVAEALAHAHAEGVIHRDIKPSNLLLDEQGKIWITDFGLAQTRGDSGLTITGDLVGTLRYMSPEQALGKRVPIDHRTDVYSLGATLYELLTLQPMIRGTDREELLRQIAFEEPLVPRRLREDMPLDLETIVLKAVEKDPRERYATSQEVADDLNRYLENSPIRARRPTAAQLVGRWCRQHRSAVTTAAIVSIACLIFAAGSWWWITQDRIQRQQKSLAAISQALGQAKTEKKNAESAAAKEKAANALSQKRLKQIKRGYEILTTIFHDLDIDKLKQEAEPLGAVLTERLVKAAEQLDGEVIGDPILVASTQNELGASLLSLGEPLPAIPLLTKALATYQTLLGVGHPDTLVCMKNLARAYVDAGNLDEGIPLCEQTLQLCESTLGSENRLTLVAMSNLSNAYQAAGSNDKAILLLETILETERSTLSPDHPDLLLTLASLAAAQLGAGDTANALLTSEQIVPALKAKLGASHPSTLTATNNMALAYKRSKQFDKAVEILEATVRDQVAEIGRTHPTTLNMMNNLGSAYHEAGKLELAITTLSEAVEAARVRPGPNHWITLTGMHNLGSAQLAMGNFGAAITILNETLKTREDTLGANHPDTLLTMDCLATAYGEAGELEKALPLFKECLRRSEENLGSDHPHTLMVITNLGVAYLESGDIDHALPILEESLGRQQRRSGADHPATLRIVVHLARAFIESGKVPQAQELLETALSVQRGKLGFEHPDALRTRIDLAWIYQRAGKLDQAIPLLVETLSTCKARLGIDHPTTLVCTHALAVALQNTGKPDQALPLLEETLELRKAKLGLDHPATLVSMHSVADAYLTMGQPVKAVPIFDETLRRHKAKAGTDHRATLKVMYNAAAANRAAGRLDEALALFEESLRLRKCKLGDDHPETLRSMGGVAATYWSLRQLDKSVAMYEELRNRQEAKLGRQHPDTQHTVANLGVNYNDANRLDEAIPLLEEAYASSRKMPDHRWVAGPLRDAYVKAGKTAEMVKLANERHAELRATLPKDSPQLAGQLALFALALLKVGAFAEAETLLVECLAIRQKNEPDVWTTFNTQSMVGHALLGQKRYAEAEPLLLAGYEGMKEREKSIPPEGSARIPEALDRLIQLYTETDNPDELSKWETEKARLGARADVPAANGAKP